MFSYAYVCLCMCVNIGACRSQRRHWLSLEMQFQAVVRPQKWVLGTELMSLQE